MIHAVVLAAGESRRMGMLTALLWRLTFRSRSSRSSEVRGGDHSGSWGTRGKDPSSTDLRRGHCLNQDYQGGSCPR
jgi:hypothetical protein